APEAALPDRDRDPSRLVRVELRQLIEQPPDRLLPERARPLGCLLADPPREAAAREDLRERPAVAALAEEVGHSPELGRRRAAFEDGEVVQDRVPDGALAVDRGEDLLAVGELFDLEADRG